MDKRNKVIHLKGLGEMTAESLAYTCMDPATRVVTTIKEIGDVERLYQLMGVNPSYRKKLIMEEVNATW